MTEDYYHPVAHALVRALRDVRLPLDRGGLLETCGATLVEVRPGETTTIAGLMDRCLVARFETAASLHNALMAALRMPEPPAVARVDAAPAESPKSTATSARA